MSLKWYSGGKQIWLTQAQRVQKSRSMQGGYKRGKYRTPYSSAPSGYSRSAAQRRGARYARARRQGRQFAYPRARYRRNTTTMGFLGIEKKFYDTGLANAVITSPADATGGEHDPSATSMISTPVRGDSEQNRDGKSISIMNCTVKGIVEIPASELDTEPGEGIQVKVCLVLDTQTNGAQLNSEDVFKNTIAATKLAASPQKNLLFMNRFRILKSQTFTLTPTSLSHIANDAFSHNGVSRLFNWFVPFSNGLKVNFNAGTTASVANVIDNSLHIVAFCSNTTGAPTLSYNARIRFVG